MLIFCRHHLIIRMRRKKEADEEVDEKKDVEMEGEDDDKECDANEENEEKYEICVSRGGSMITIETMMTVKTILPQ